MSFCIMLTMKFINSHFFAHGCTVQVQQTRGMTISCFRVFRELWKKLRQKWPWPSLLVYKLSTVGASPSNLAYQMGLSSQNGRNHFWKAARWSQIFVPNLPCWCQQLRAPLILCVHSFGRNSLANCLFRILRNDFMIIFKLLMFRFRLGSSMMICCVYQLHPTRTPVGCDSVVGLRVEADTWWHSTVRGYEQVLPRSAYNVCWSVS